MVGLWAKYCIVPKIYIQTWTETSSYNSEEKKSYFDWTLNPINQWSSTFWTLNPVSYYYWTKIAKSYLCLKDTCVTMRLGGVGFEELVTKMIFSKLLLERTWLFSLYFTMFTYMFADCGRYCTENILGELLGISLIKR